MRFVIIGMLLVVAACSSSKSERELKQDLDLVYIGSGVEKFFLSDLPSWANFSSLGHCRRQEPIRYLNFETMYKNYSMEYEELVQFQYMLNKQFASYKISTGRKTIFLKDESYIMHNVHEQIIGGGRDFIVPNFKRIHLIWIDFLYNNADGIQKLKTLMGETSMEQGHPAFVSTCLSAMELEEFINTYGFSKMGVKSISQEMFSPYDKKFKLTGSFSLDFQLLLPGKQLYFFGPSLPEEFIGIEPSRFSKF